MSPRKSTAPKSGECESPMQPYLDRLYLEARAVLFRILLGDMTVNPMQSEMLDKIALLIDEDEHLAQCRTKLAQYFPGRLARLFNLVDEDDELYPPARLREAIRLHLQRRQHDPAGTQIDAVDRSAIELLKGPSRLQQQLAYLVNYTPGKWLLEQEIPVVLDSRRVRLKETPGGSAGEVPAQTEPGCGPTYVSGMDPYAWSRDVGRMRGLCLSGGGIRSATFNLGILQGLAKKNLLREFDYLSSVSGGGYIHQWLAAWIKREEKRGEASGRTGLDVVTEELVPQPDSGCTPFSPEPIRWLRRYSNYLTPEVGIMSADFWVTVAIWMRNTLLNQIILISAIFSLLLLPRVFLFAPIAHELRKINSLTAALCTDPRAACATGSQNGYAFHWSHAAILVLLGIAYLLPVRTLAAGLYATRRSRQGLERLSDVTIGLTVALPFLIAAVLISDFGFYFVIPGLSRNQQTDALCGFTFAGIVILSLALTWAGGGFISEEQKARPEHTNEDSGGSGAPVLLRIAGFSMAAMLSGAVCAACMYGARNWCLDWLRLRNLHFGIPEPSLHWRVVVAFGPAFVVAVSFLGIVLHCGLVGKDFEDWALEWLGRARAWITMYSLAATAWLALGFFGYDAVHLLMTGASRWAGWPALGAWALTTAASVLTGKSAHSGGDSNGQRGPLLSRLLTAAGPPVYIAGLLLLLSWASTLALHAASLGWKLAGTDADHGWAVLSLLLISWGTFALFGWRVDVNEFSMHSYYRNRLARCYLGASNVRRNPDPLTGFDQADIRGMELSKFQPAKGYSGPLPIFCTTLNISTGEDLAWQERKAASFAFSPVLSGYHVPWTGSHYRGQLSFNGFVPTDRFSNDTGGLHISTAAAISGAAVSPDMGYHSSAPMAFLLTMFNARLGWWMQNPRRSPLAFNPSAARGNYLRSTPRFAPWQLLQELLGRIRDDSDFVYLTDGGHFDNMGLYELVRRRCQEIVICDAEQDDGPVFDGIGMAIRKCRIDFGVEIELDLNQMAVDAATRLSRTHWITGTIRYPETGNAEPGTLLYIKSSITGQEAADVYNYRLQHTAFPQDSTTDQWFTESQFESYRRLGQQVADQCPYLR